jgi:hypothetical protein
MKSASGSILGNLSRGLPILLLTETERAVALSDTPKQRRPQKQNSLQEVRTKLSVTWVRQVTIPIERPPLLREVSANFCATEECRVVSVTDPYGRILGFLDRSRYFFFQVAPQLYSRGWVDPIPDPLLLRKSGSAGNRTRASGCVARKPSDSKYLLTR